MRKFLVVLVVLAGLLVAADRILVSAAERVVARRAQVAADLEERPTVQIRGFPFLTQAVRGLYQRIDVSMAAAERGDIRLENLAVHLKDVDAPLAQMLREDGSVTVRADSARATVIVPYTVLEQRLPSGVNAQFRGDRLRLTGEVSVFGQERPATAVLEVATSEGGITFEATRVRVEGRAVPEAFGDQLSFTVEVPELPFGLHMTGVKPTANGVRITATGQDVLLTGTPPRAASDANVTRPFNRTEAIT